MRVKPVVLSVLLVIVPIVCHAEDRGFFHCMKLSDDQKKWFESDGVKNCCKLADGMPVRFEERATGTYIPPFEVAYFEAVACRDDTAYQFGSPLPPLKDGQEEDRSKWIRVKENLLLRKSNPIGVGVVWWANAGYPSTQEHDVRCFVGLDKV